MEQNSASAAFVERLRSDEPLLGVELRPPRADLSDEQSMDSWMGMYGTVRRMLARDTILFITDRAVGAREEENLHHLVTNLEAEDVSRGRVCPFLTAKHTMEYCLWYATRAVDAGCPALTVLGGDRNVGPPRCVNHAYELRMRIRERFPELPLGGWANPYRDAAEQVGFVLDEHFTADFVLTQLVSHHDLAPMERFVEEARRRGVTVPIVAGVFYYRSANPKTLERLSSFFRVPVEGLKREFGEEGLSAPEVCARTILALRDIGIDKVYLSNLHPDRAVEQLEAIHDLVD
ncbi:MAG: hypothetical protein ACQEXJ_17530 [Myxococcota bacterium]